MADQPGELCAYDESAFNADGLCALGHTREDSRAYAAERDTPYNVLLEDPMAQERAEAAFIETFIEHERIFKTEDEDNNPDR